MFVLILKHHHHRFHDHALLSLLEIRSRPLNYLKAQAPKPLAAAVRPLLPVAVGVRAGGIHGRLGRAIPSTVSERWADVLQTLRGCANSSSNMPHRSMHQHE